MESLVSSKFGALQVPWNFTKLLASAKLAHSKFHGIPWFFFKFNGTICIINTVSLKFWIEFRGIVSLQILMTIISNFVGWISLGKLIITLYLFVCLFHQLMFRYQYLHYTTWMTYITHYVSKYLSKYLFNAHRTHFDQKVPWSFLQSSMELWTTFEQHSSSMEFRGILSRSKVP